MTFCTVFCSDVVGTECDNGFPYQVPEGVTDIHAPIHPMTGTQAELLANYRQYRITRTREIAVELMQLYTDLRRYQAASFYLTHFERLSVLYVFGHMGEPGKKFIHDVMSHTLNYSYNVTEKFIRKCPERPISCIKLQDQYKRITAEIGCNCVFKMKKNCYPSPVLHAILMSPDMKSDITIPISRTITQERKQQVLDDMNIHKKALTLARQILEYKKQKRGLDRSIKDTEKQLSEIFDNAQIEQLETDMGVLTRRKQGNGYEFVIEL